MSELKVFQAIRLKGRVTPDDLAATLNDNPGRVAATIAELTAAGFLVEAKMLRISPLRLRAAAHAVGRGKFRHRHGRDHRRLPRFPRSQHRLQDTSPRRQLKDGEPNTHVDADYDAAVLHRLDRIHNLGLTDRRRGDRAGAAAQRISATSSAAALEKIKAGETIWLTRAMIDSYHTVWFELHEELIRCGTDPRCRSQSRRRTITFRNQTRLQASPRPSETPSGRRRSMHRTASRRWIAIVIVLPARSLRPDRPDGSQCKNRS